MIKNIRKIDKAYLVNNYLNIISCMIIQTLILKYIAVLIIVYWGSNKTAQWLLHGCV